MCIGSCCTLCSYINVVRTLFIPPCCPVKTLSTEETSPHLSYLKLSGQGVKNGQSVNKDFGVSGKLGV